MPKAKAEKPVEIQIDRIGQSSVHIQVIGSSPIILNRMSAKAKRELLLPRGRMSAADKRTNLKHDPLKEYRDSAIQLKSGPTVLAIPAAAFKRAIAQATLDVPGAAKKAQIARLTRVPGEYVHIYGEPKMYITAVRSADINRTPDMRTRAVVPLWAAEFDVTYATPMLTATPVLNLLDAAGIIVGVGDGRMEKGWGNFGQFEMVTNAKMEKRFDSIRKAGGRKIQEAAMIKPGYYEEESQELHEWWESEVARRGGKRPVIDEPEPDEAPAVEEEESELVAA